MWVFSNYFHSVQKNLQTQNKSYLMYFIKALKLGKYLGNSTTNLMVVPNLLVANNLIICYTFDGYVIIL